MFSKILVGGVTVLVVAIFSGGSGNAQSKTVNDANKLQRLLGRFPQADANGDGSLTEREAEEYRQSRRKEKARASKTEAPASATRLNVQYGSHERNCLDLWQAKSEQPAPVLIFFHGGSFKAGDKAIVAERPILRECLAAGISVVSANYRFSSDAPYPASMLDGARVVQFVRSRAKEWNIDPRRIAVSGSSAGATLALWIALHDDLADEKSPDPVLRQSTRVACASPHSGTAGLTSDYFHKHAGVTKQGAALWQLFGAATQAEFESVAKQELAREGSPLTHATADDPPLFLTYQGDPGEAPFAVDAAQSKWIHHVCLGLPLQARYEELGRECDLYYQSQPAAADAEIEFLKKQLFAAHPVSAIEPQAAAGPPSHIYKSLGERKLQLVVHYPPDWRAQDKRTAVLFFSGSHKVQPGADGKLPPLAAERAQLGLPAVNRGPGGEHHVEFLNDFARRGYVALHVEYRTRGKDGVLPGEDMADAASAIRWVRTHAAELGIDPNRVVAAGGSSGGYLAASLFAFEDRFPDSQPPQVSVRPSAILLYSPLVDWLEVGSMSESFLVVLGGDRELGARISPARHWRKDCPPMLVMVGSEEPPFVTVKQFAEKWRAAGAPIELFVADGAPHGFFAKSGWVEKTHARTDEFLARHQLEAIRSATQPIAPAGGRTATEVYKTIGERKLQLAVHYPPNWQPADQRPAMLLFGGGAFNPQDRDTGETVPVDSERKPADHAGRGGGPGQAFATEAEHFARLGLVTVRVEYRKRRTDGVLPDKAVEDAKSAMRWVRSNAQRLGIDPNRIVACGGSSGGYLAASLASLEGCNAPADDLRISTRPNLLVLHYPLLDFLVGGTRKLPFLDALGGDKALGERLSPARHWTKDMPPTLIFIGTKDPTFQDTSAFVRKWKEAGGNLDVFVGEGAGHGFSSTSTWHDRTLPRMESFLRQAGFLTSAVKKGAQGASPAKAGSGSSAPLLTLIEQLRSPSEESRFTSALSILESGRAAEIAYPDLIQALINDEALDVRVAARAIYARPRSAADASELAKALQLNTKARVAAAWEISRIGPAAANEVTAPLLAALVHTDKHERNFVALALATSSDLSPPVLAALRKIANDSGPQDSEQTNYRFPRALASVILDFGRDSTPAATSDVQVSSLVWTLAAESSRINPAVVAGLRVLGQFAGANESGTAKPSQRTRPVVHESISLAIGYLDSLTQPPTPERIAREEQNGKLSEESRLYVMALGGIQQHIAAAMRQSLAAGEHDERILAIRRLAALGPAAKDASPVLQAKRSDLDWLVRRESFVALRQIAAESAKPTP